MPHHPNDTSALFEQLDLQQQLDDLSLVKANLQAKLSFNFVHGWALFVAWNIFGLLQIITARYMKDKWQTNMVLHTASGTMITLNSMFFGFWKIMMQNGFDVANTWQGKVQIGRTSNGQRKYIHTFSAMSVPLMGVPLMITGFIPYFRRWQAGSGATTLMRWRDLHKYLSWFMTIVAIFGTTTGVYSYNKSKQNTLLWIGVPIQFFVPLIVLEIRHQLFMRQFVKFTTPLVSITEEEFYAITRRGKRHLLLLDDLVLDATDYAPYHPGGKFIIERTRGTDISKFFYGGYNLEPATGGTNYNHTNYGRLACNSLIIGKLVRGVETCTVRIAEATNASIDQNIKTFKFVPAQGQYLPKQVMRHYPIDGTGKHFLMQKIENGQLVGNIRHYTVSNCMAADQYKDYCETLKSHIEAQKGTNIEKIRRLDSSLYRMELATNFSLTLKAYYDAKGFSAKMFESWAAKENGEWYCKGPMGKSLGVRKSGTHLAFAAGTGTITFMDLSAYVARLVMNEMEEKERGEIDENFRFEYYVTYFDEKQACGLEMLRLLDALQSKHFKLVVRLSSQKSRRWDQAFLNEILPPTCEKLWICGTPVMNDVFEQAFHHLAPKFPYLKDLEVVQVL